MKAKLTKQLAKESFDNNVLVEKRVKTIAGKLKRKDTRSYLKALKVIEQKNTLYVSMPVNYDESIQKALKFRFPDKKIVYILNKDLLAGMKIIDNDILYDFTLQGKIERLIRHLYDTND